MEYVYCAVRNESVSVILVFTYVSVDCMSSKGLFSIISDVYTSYRSSKFNAGSSKKVN